MLNQCTFIGRLTRKPEFRQTSSGKCFTLFTLAVERDIPSQDGEWVTDFIDFVAWNKLAVKVYNKYDKGDLLVASGRLQNRTSTDKDGNKSTFSEISALYCRKITPNKPFSVTDNSSSVASAVSNDFVALEDDDAQLPF